MNISIRFTRQTSKSLVEQLKQAYTAGDLRLVRRISALLGLATGETVAQVAETLSVSREVVCNPIRAFMLHGVDSLVRRRATGTGAISTQASSFKPSLVISRPAPSRAEGWTCGLKPRSRPKVWAVQTRPMRASG